MYAYKFILDRVVDGDTVDGYIDLGFGVSIFRRVRLYGIDAPETRTKDLEEKDRGLQAKQWLELALMKAEITLKTEKDKSGKYGRILGTLFVKTVNLNQKMVDMKLAKDYMV